MHLDRVDVVDAERLVFVCVRRTDLLPFGLLKLNLGFEAGLKDFHSSAENTLLNQYPAL